MVGIDSFAGPSEVVVLADASLPPEFAAADLLAQAEHGPGGSAVLVAWDPAVIDAVNAAIERLLAVAPRRAEIESTLGTGGRAVLVDDAAAALAVVNEIAPEHLELLVADPDALVPGVRNAGAVFCGPWAPAALGDYVAGVNHVLPTARTARFASALRVDTFRKHVHVVRATEAGLAGVAPALEALAAAEGLEAHAASVAAASRVPGRRSDAVSRPASRRATTSARSRATTRRSSTCRCGSTPTRARSRRRPSSWTAWTAALARRAAAPLPRPRARPSCAPRSASSSASPPSGSSAPTAPTRCCRRCCSPTAAPAGAAAVFEPTYALHSHIARITATEVVVGERRADFSIDPDAAVALVERERPTLTFVCSPNNPTGTVEPAATIDAILARDRRHRRGRRGLRRVRATQRARARARRRPPRGGAHLLEGVVDGRAAARLRGRARVGRRGARQGRAAVPPRRRHATRRVASRSTSRPRWTTACTASSTSASASPKELDASPASRCTRRAPTSCSSGCSMRRPRGVGAAWSSAGVLVRDFSRWPRLAECLRVTIGTPEENDAFLGALRAALRTEGAA